jgi:hypothetical protein
MRFVFRAGRLVPDDLPRVRAIHLASYADPPAGGTPPGAAPPAGAPPAGTPPGAAPPTGTPPYNAEDHWVPKTRFNEINARMQAAEAEAARLKAAGTGGADVARITAERDLARLGLTSPEAADYAMFLHARQQGAPPIGDWVKAQLADPNANPVLRNLFQPQAPGAAPAAPPATPPAAGAPPAGGQPPGAPVVAPPGAPPGPPPGAPPIPPAGPAPAPGTSITQQMIDAAYAKAVKSGTKEDLDAARAMAAQVMSGVVAR